MITVLTRDNMELLEVEELVIRKSPTVFNQVPTTEFWGIEAITNGAYKLVSHKFFSQTEARAFLLAFYQAGMPPTYFVDAET